jgi:hypothetical protein
MYRSRNQAELTAWAFDIVYFAALYSQLSNNELAMLEQHLPRYFLIPSWDICQRLRIAITEMFISEKLSPVAFLQITLDPNLFSEFINISKKMKKAAVIWLKSGG